MSGVPTTFTHPGVLLSRSDLDFLRSKVRNGEQPWTNAYRKMMASGYASLSYVPRPRSVVECGPYSKPNLGCTNERKDAIAAYTHALAWYVTGEPEHARKSVQIINAWSATIRDHTNSNAKLQAAWAGSVWPRAAEIIRYTYGGWKQDQIDRFASMLRNVYLPEVNQTSYANGNWELSMTEASIGIAVFLNDRAVYAAARSRFLTRVPAYVYLTSDGKIPRTVTGSGRNTASEIFAYWHGQRKLVNGLAQETCRDFGHTGYGLSAMSHVAETARIQGDDLYRQIGTRLKAAFEFHSKYERGADVPSWLCRGRVQRGLGPVTEPALATLTNRGMSLPQTRALTLSSRPAGTENHFIAWETLTDAAGP